MKKNLLGVLVIVFVVFASILAVKEISEIKPSEVNAQQFYADFD